MNKIKLSVGDTTIVLTSKGDIETISTRGIDIHRYTLTDKGSISNMYLRIYRGYKIASVVPLRGLLSGAMVTAGSSLVSFANVIDGLQVVLFLALADNNTIFWRCKVEPLYDVHTSYDIVYVQDIGLSGKVNSHYIFDTPQGYSVAYQCDDVFVHVGSLGTQIVGFDTDAYEDISHAHSKGELPELLQFELNGSNIKASNSCVVLSSKILTPPHNMVIFNKIVFGEQPKPQDISRLVQVYDRLFSQKITMKECK